MLNVVALLGRLVSDPELKHTPNDVAVTSFTIAVDRSYAKAGTERQTDFIEVVAWRGTAEFICRYFEKGQLIAVHGSIQTRSYTDKEGNKRKVVEVLASNVSFAGSKSDNQESYAVKGASPDINPPEESRPAAFSEQSYPQEEFEEILTDDDLPF